MINNEYPPAGCVTAAVALVMAANRKPFVYNWNAMIDDLYGAGQIEVARLYKDVASTLNTTFGEGSSSANNKNVPGCFRHFGFSGTHDVESYNWDALKKEIMNGRTVYMSAFEFRTTHYKRNWIFWRKKYYTYEGGHAWALDGLRVMKRKVETINSKGNIISSRYEQIQLVHCNMGWYGIGNGYYNDGIFDTNRGPLFTRSTEGTEYYFRFNMEMVKNIH